MTAPDEGAGAMPLVRAWHRLSLLARTTLGASAALLFAGALLLVVSTEREAAQARAHIEERLAAEIGVVPAAITEWAVIGDYASIEQALRLRVQATDVRRIEWRDARGKTVATTDKDGVREAPQWFADWTGVPAPRSFRELLVGGRSYGQVGVEMTATPAQNALWSAFRSNLLFFALALGLDLVAIYLILRRGLAPLAALTEGARRMARGEYSHRIVPGGSPEMRRVVVAFNQMAEGVATAQGALHDEAERLAVTLASIGDGVIATDADGRIEFINPVAETLTGWTAAQARLRLVTEVFAIAGERTHEPVPSPVMAALREGTIATLGDATLLRSRDGTERPVADAAAPIRDHDGNIVGAVLVFRDQSRERNTLASLALAASVFRNSQHGIVITDAQRRIVEVNPAFTRITGYVREELLGRTPRLLAPNREDADFYDALWAQVRAGGQWQGEMWNRTRTGELRPCWVAISSVRQPDETGPVTHYVGSYVDIAQRKRAEDALRDSEERLRLALDAALMVAWRWDVESGRTDWGDNPDLLLGPKPAEDYPDFRDMVLAEDRACFLAASREAMAGRGNYEVEFRLRRTDGDVCWILARGRVRRDAEGRAVAITGVSQDITQRKKVEAELESHRHRLEALVHERTAALSLAKEAAEAASVAKSAFLANMSHEIRTPMNAIVGMAHLMRRGGVTPEQAERLDKIDAAAHHLLGVINDILDLSKIEAGKFELEQAPVSVTGLLDNVASILADRIRAKGLRLNIECGPMPAGLAGDPTRLQQALLNYAANAVKFTDSGSVTLRAEKLDETPDALRVRFVVEDTGIGIAPEAMERLFGAFEQADSSTTRKYGGTGLGLAITRRLAQLMGGDAGGENLARGSRFWFTVQLRKCAAPAAGPAATADAEEALRRRHGGKRVLVADDEPINREIAQMQLEAAGLEVDVAEDGAQAVTMAREGGYAVILMDMQMPRLDGLDATRQIRALPGVGTRPVIAMTANAFAEDKARCLAAGMNDFLIKPFDPDALFAIVLRWLDQPPQDR